MSALVQQLDRFQGAHRYHGRQPLAELTFVVTVWCSPLIEEERREQLCQVRLSWGDKIPSPAERIHDVQQWVRNVVVPQKQQQQQQPDVSISGGEHDGTEMRPLTLISTPDIRHPLADVLQAMTVDHAGQPQPLIERARSFFGSGAMSFFTRPPAEDYVDRTEFISPLEPEQATSPLAAIVLSHHRTEHRGNPNMYLMWSVGHVDQRPGRWRQMLPADMSQRMGGNPFYAEVCDLDWSGEDVVFCTITRQTNSDTAFLAKPSLNEEHTLLVTSKHIYSFVVSVVETAAPSGTATSVQGAAAVPERGTATGSCSAADVDKLVASGGLGTADLNAPHYITDVNEKQRRTMLRQAVLKGRVTSGNRQPSPNAGRPSRSMITPMGAETVFTPLPPHGDGTSVNPTMRRVHVFGTVERARGFHCDSLFARMRWILPEGAVLDTTSCSRSGIAYQPTEIVSQLAFGCRIVNEDYAFDTQHNFNLPFEIHVLVPETQKKHLSAVFTVLSRGSGGDEHAAPEGYGSAWFATTAGSRNETIGLWRPRKTGFELLKSIFLGGGPSLAEDTCVGLPPGASSFSSRLGLTCESGGSLVIQYFVVTHEHEAVAPPPATSSAGGGTGSLLQKNSLYSAAPSGGGTDSYASPLSTKPVVERSSRSASSNRRSKGAAAAGAGEANGGRERRKS